MNHQKNHTHTLFILIVMLASMAVTIIGFGTTSNAADVNDGEDAIVEVAANPAKDETQYLTETEQKLYELSLVDDRFAEVLENKNEYPQYLLDALSKKPDLIELVLIYGTGYDPSACYITISELEQNIPLFIQWDNRWGYAEYGDDIIALSGCGPACLSMAAVGLTHNPAYTPKAVADYAMEQNYYRYGTGTSWLLMTEGCEEFGLHSEEIMLDCGEIYAQLEEGHPIICSMMPGDFTDVGHFIILVGIEDGKIRLNDPNSYENSAKLWEYSELEWQIRNMWAFTAL